MSVALNTQMLKMIWLNTNFFNVIRITEKRLMKIWRRNKSIDLNYLTMLWMILLVQTGFYPYGYMDDWEKFSEK